MESWGDLAKQLWWEMTPQTNYHGTPYTFNKFDDSNFLKGEGAMAHGAGHYSADFLNTAKLYKRPSIDIFKGDAKIQDYVGHLRSFLERVQPHIDDAEYLEHEKESLLKRLENAKRSDVYMQKYKGIPTESERLRLQLDALDNLDKYKVQYNKGNLYKVNVPNENFMLNMDKSLNDQSNYIKSAIKKFYDSKDIPNSTKDIYKYLDMDSEYDTKNLYKWLAQDMVNHSYIDPYNNNIGEIEASKMLNKYGIKGIRANGRRDGGINVTFTGKDIKMANTPWQRFINRIPTQTLSKMASKLYNTPGVKQAIRFTDRVATPLMILEGIGLNQPAGQGSDQPPIYPVNGMLKGYITNEY